MDVRPGKTNNALNALMDTSSIKKEFVAKFPHFVINSIERKESARNAIKDIPSSMAAVRSLNKMLDVLNGMVTNALNAPKDGTLTLRVLAFQFQINVLPGTMVTVSDVMAAIFSIMANV